MKEVAYNPIRKTVETVHREDEVPEQERIPMFWSKTLNRWVTVPQD